MNDEYDYEVDSAREWLGLDQDMPLTVGEAAWMLVQLLGISAFVLGAMLLAGLATGAV